MKFNTRFLVTSILILNTLIAPSVAGAKDNQGVPTELKSVEKVTNSLIEENLLLKQAPTEE
ncbi:hypothetical protein, partial [Enterococcus hirae]|uniref:hypothetical protein n=1 Tax=Enterococcus hirae TaxID=1354 RepID=UPI001A95F739